MSNIMYKYIVIFKYNVNCIEERKDMICEIINSTNSELVYFIFNTIILALNVCTLIQSKNNNKQRCGLELYEKRKEVIEKAKKGNFSAIDVDINILFGAKINNYFKSILNKEKEISTLNNDLDFYAERLESQDVHKKEALEDFLFDCNDPMSDEDLHSLKEVTNDTLFYNEESKRYVNYYQATKNIIKIENELQSDKDKFIGDLIAFVKKTIK